MIDFIETVLPAVADFLASPAIMPFVCGFILLVLLRVIRDIIDI